MRWPFGKGDAAEDDALRPLRGAEELDGLGRHEAAVVYKHSSLCGASARALRQVRAFATGHPDTPIYVIDVIRQRGLARAVEELYGIRHESPQAILLRRGEPAWHGSHFGVTVEALRAAIESRSGTE